MGVKVSNLGLLLDLVSSDSWYVWHFSSLKEFKLGIYVLSNRISTPHLLLFSLVQRIPTFGQTKLSQLLGALRVVFHTLLELVKLFLFLYVHLPYLPKWLRVFLKSFWVFLSTPISFMHLLNQSVVASRLKNLSQTFSSVKYRQRS
jgi:hypothetical protein